MTPEKSTRKEADAMAKTKVRTTIEPGVVLTVDDSELLDLDRQGLIHSSESGKYGKAKWPAADKAEKTADKADSAADAAEKKGA
jgi:hypothetical protein